MNSSRNGGGTGQLIGGPGALLAAPDRVTGVLLAVVDTLVNFAFVTAYPVWSIVAVGLDVIVIYALVAHGREARVLGR